MNTTNFKVIIRVRPLQTKQKQEITAYEQVQIKKFKNQSNKIVKLSPMAYSFYAKFYNIANLEQIIKIQSPTIYVIDPQYKNIQKKMRPYTFSQVYAQQQSSKDIFQSSLEKQINCIYEGYNCTVLAYGITGSGKTHTIFGNKQCQQKGISEQIFSTIIQRKNILESSKQVKVSLAFSFVQIYNQNVRDLLTPQTKLVNVIQDSKGNTSITDLLQVEISNIQDIMKLVEIGLTKRSFGATNANQYSSRSHAVLQMNIKIYRQKTQTTAKMFIIDLAGSQKLQGLNSAKKMQQGANINKSLLSLGNCITILADNSKKSNLNGSIMHIPYRDSKLTRILKDSLGGNAKTIMISCISSNPFTIEQTITTLNYAQRAQGIKKIITKNELQLSRNRQCSCKSDIVLKLFRNKLKSIQEQVQHKENVFQSLFDQIYEDLVDNIRQGQNINAFLKDSQIEKSKLNQIQNIQSVNIKQRKQLKQTFSRLFQQKNKIYKQQISGFLQKQLALGQPLQLEYTEEKKDNECRTINSKINQQEGLQCSLFTQFASVKQPLRQINLSNNSFNKIQIVAKNKNKQNNQKNKQLKNNQFQGSSKKFSFGQIQQTPSKQIQSISNSQGLSIQKSQKRKSKSKFQVVKKAKQNSAS